MRARDQEELAPLHPVLRERWLACAAAMEALGTPVLISEGGRDWDRQAALFAKGRTALSDVGCHHQGETAPRKPGTCTVHPLGATVTRAPAGFSWHQFYLALDAEPDNLDLPGLQPDWNVEHPGWHTLLSTAKSYQLAEGAEWRTYPDCPHFYPRELPATPPQNVRDVFQKVGGGQAGIAAVWAYVERTWFVNVNKAAGAGS